ncbi:MAG: hypothetical protein HGB19_00810 [Chlorobiales bacterium]|jgi:hypothetical protein|nr:hypothetical protein [Chlorobiales bacterium]
MLIFSLTLWVAIYFVIGFSSPATTAAIFFAWLIMGLNSLAGYVIFDRAYGKNIGKFNVYVMGGLGVRLLISLLVVALVILKEWLPFKPFVFSLFAFYTVFVILEIMGYLKKNQFEKQREKTNESTS